MTFYADLKQGEDIFNLAIDAPSFAVAVSMAAAWASGFLAGKGGDYVILESMVSGKKPRGKTYFPLVDADAIRRGLKL